MTQNNGGSAFPIQPASTPDMHHLGMTLRDYFAAQALPHIIGSLEDWPDDKSELSAHAELSYMYADAMLEARK